MSSSGRGRSQGSGPNRRQGRDISARKAGGSPAVQKKGLTAALGSHIFDYGDKDSADQMKVTWEKVCNHIGNTLNQELATEILTGKKIVPHMPTIDDALVQAHKQREDNRKDRLRRLIAVKERLANALRTQATKGDITAEVQLVELENDIGELKEKAATDYKLELTGNEKTQHEQATKMYFAKMEKLNTYRGQSFSIIKVNAANH
jgi:hypothetical protein